MKRIHIVMTMAAVIIGGAFVQDARAALITLEFEGTVTSVLNMPAGTFSAGQTLLGTYTFDTTTLDDNPQLDIDVYIGAVNSLAFTIAGAGFSYAGSLEFGFNGNIALVDGSSLSDPDYYYMTAPVSGNPVDGLVPYDLNFNFSDQTGNADGAYNGVFITGNTAALALDYLSDYPNREWNLNFSSIVPNASAVHAVYGTITDLRVPTPIIPEPTSLLLLGTGLGALGLIGFRRRKIGRK